MAGLELRVSLATLAALAGFGAEPQITEAVKAAAVGGKMHKQNPEKCWPTATCSKAAATTATTSRQQQQQALQQQPLQQQQELTINFKCVEDFNISGRLLAEHGESIQEVLKG